MPTGVEVLAFADDLALVATAREITVVEQLLEAAAEITILWLQEVGLEVAIEKSEAIVFTNHRTRNTLAISLRGTRIESKESIKYLGVHLDPKLNYSVHAKIAAAKATKTTRSLGRIMPNVGAPKARKRKLLATVLTSQTLYGCQVWADKMTLGGWENLKRSQRSIMLRVTSAYRTASSDALNILSGIPPIDLQAMERMQNYMAGKEGRNKTEAREISKRELQANWQDRWHTKGKGEWTKKIIPEIHSWLNRKHGEVNYHVTQALTGHGCFAYYLHKYIKLESPKCWFCDQNEDNAHHTLFICDAFESSRRELRYQIGVDDTNEVKLIELMVKSKEGWTAIENFMVNVMKKKEAEERRRQSIPMQL